MRKIFWPLVAWAAAATWLPPVRAVSWQATATALDVAGETGDRRSHAYGISADGRFALIQSEASDIGEGVTPSGTLPDVFVHDSRTRSLELISHWNLEPDTQAGGFARGLSEDGRFVLYDSYWSTLVRDQVSGSSRYVYLHDRQTGYVQQVSHAVGNRDLPLYGEAIDFSADGRWILFQSHAANLVAGFQSAGSARTQLYLYDRDSATAQLVSHRHDGVATACNSAINYAMLSRDGRRVLYSTPCNDIVPLSGGVVGDDVYLYDRETHANLLVSRSAIAPDRAGNGIASIVGISADGTTVAYATRATDVQAGSDTNGGADLYLFDVASATSQLVSRSAVSPTQTANRSSTFGRLSADGQFLLFETAATDLDGATQDAANTQTDVFLFDRAASAISLVSHAAGTPTVPASGASSISWVSADGSRALFRSAARNVAAGVTLPALTTSQIYLYERTSGESTLLSHRDGATADAANLSSTRPQPTPDASHIVFDTMATDAIRGLADDNGQPDVFLLERATGSLTLASRANPSTVPRLPNFALAAVAASDDGRHVLLRGSSTNFLPGLGNRRTYIDAFDLDTFQDLFLHDRATGESTLVNSMREAPFATSNSSSPTTWVLSRDGRFVAYGATTSQAWNMGTNTEQVFLFDRETRLPRLVTHVAGNPDLAATATSQTGPMTPDGRWVTYASAATNLEAGQNDTGSNRDVFVYDREADTSRLVTRRVGTNTLANAPSSPRGISDDGVWILFQTSATNLVPDVTDPNFSGNDVYLANRQDGTMVLVSRSSVVPTRTASASSNALALSSDGRYVVFSSAAADLVAGVADANGSALDLYLFDRLDGGVRLISRSRESATRTLASASTFAQASRDGRFVLFRNADPAVTGEADANAANDTFLFDAATGEVELVSRAAAGGTPSMASDQPAMSEDGRWIAFRTAAPDVVAGDENAVTDVFVLDRESGRTSRASHSPLDAAASLPLASSLGALSVDGRVITINTASPNVVAGVSDPNFMSDAFAVQRGSTVRWIAQGDGHLDPAGERFVPAGAGAIYDVVAGAGHKLFSITGCGGALQEATYVLAAVDDDCVIDALFRRFHALIYRAGTGGQLIGIAGQEVFDGEDGSAVAASPLAGFKFTRWSDGSHQNPRIDESVIAAVDVEAEFRRFHVLFYRAGSGGQIAGEASQDVFDGESGSAVTAVPAPAHAFAGWSDGSSENPRIDVAVGAPLAVEATFRLLPDAIFASGFE